MIDNIKKKNLYKIQFWILCNVVFELLSTLFIGVSIANLLIFDNNNICLADYCFPKFNFMLLAFIFFLLHPLIHSLTLYKILQETNLVGFELCNEILLRITNNRLDFNNISDDEKLKITTIEAQRITSSIISPAVRILPSIIASIIILLFCAIQETFLTLILFLILTTYYLVAVIGTKNVTNKISNKISKLIANRFRGIRALIQNKSFFKENSVNSKLYHKLEKETASLSSVDALGQVIAQSPRKGLEAIIFIALIVGVYQIGGSIEKYASTLSIMIVLALKVMPNFQAIYHSIQQIRSNFSAYREAKIYLQKDLTDKRPKFKNLNSLRNLHNKIKLSKLEVNYSNERLLYPDTSFYLNKLNVIIGPSGCGKSTLLKALAQLIEYRGKIEIPKILNPEKIIYYGQRQTLLPGTILDNLLPFVQKNVKKNDFNNILDMFQVTNILKENGMTLESQLLLEGNNDISDGQKQRILLARTFLIDADLILLDEPTSNLDQKNSEIIIGAIRSLCAIKNIILSSHNMSTHESNDNYLILK